MWAEDYMGGKSMNTQKKTKLDSGGEVFRDMTPCDLCGKDGSFPVYIDEHEDSLDLCYGCWKSYVKQGVEFIEGGMKHARNV